MGYFSATSLIHNASRYLNIVEIFVTFETETKIISLIASAILVVTAVLSYPASVTRDTRWILLVSFLNLKLYIVFLTAETVDCKRNFLINIIISCKRYLWVSQEIELASCVKYIIQLGLTFGFWLNLSPAFPSLSLENPFWSDSLNNPWGFWQNFRFSRSQPRSKDLFLVLEEYLFSAREQSFKRKSIFSQFLLNSRIIYYFNNQRKITFSYFFVIVRGGLWPLRHTSSDYCVFPS